MSDDVYIWEAWVGQKIVRAESNSDGLSLIALEDGRGMVLCSNCGRKIPIVVRDLAKPVLPEFKCTAQVTKHFPSDAELAK